MSNDCLWFTMIPFFQSNSLNDKYIDKPADIEKFLKKAMQEQKLFQLTVSGLKSDSVSRIVSIDKNSKNINFEDAKHGFDEIHSPDDQFTVTAEVRTDSQIMRFESVLCKNADKENEFVVQYPREIEKTIKRQTPRYKPRKSVSIPISLQIEGRWQHAAKLTDISSKGIGILLREDSWNYIYNGLLTRCMINVQDVLCFESDLEIVHTFTMFDSGSKHAGGKFVSIESATEQELNDLINKMMSLKLIGH